MSRYTIEAYEVWVQEYEVEAEDAVSAVSAFRAGQATPLDDFLEYMELDQLRGRKISDMIESDKEALDELSKTFGDKELESIRNIGKE